MKLVLIGAASAAVLAIAAPAAAQYPPPPPPPSDADQYGPQGQDQAPGDYGPDGQDPGDMDQQNMGPGDQYGPPDGQDDGQGYDAPPGMPDDQQGYGPPPQQGGQPYVPPYQDRYGPAEGNDAAPPPGYGNDQPGPDYRQAPPAYDRGPVNPSQDYGGGPSYAPGQDLVDREQRLERRIQKLAGRGMLDPRSADAALAELRSIQDERDRMMQSGRGLSPEDEQRLSQRLEALQQRVRSMRSGG